MTILNVCRSVGLILVGVGILNYVFDPGIFSLASFAWAVGVAVLFAHVGWRTVAAEERNKLLQKGDGSVWKEEIE